MNATIEEVIEKTGISGNKIFKNFIAKVETVKNGVYDSKKLESFMQNIEKIKKKRADE